MSKTFTRVVAGGFMAAAFIGAGAGIASADTGSLDSNTTANLHGQGGVGASQSADAWNWGSQTHLPLDLPQLPQIPLPALPQIQLPQLPPLPTAADLGLPEFQMPELPHVSTPPVDLNVGSSFANDTGVHIPSFGS